MTRLREATRLAMNIDEGYEISVGCDICGAEHWLRVIHALHVTAPIPVSSFKTAGYEPCMEPGTRFSAHPRARILSRRGWQL